MKLADIPKTTQLFWYVLGETLCNMIYDRVEAGQNVDEKKFADYDKDYADRKVAGKAAFKGQSQASKSPSPNMRLTGKTMANLHLLSATKEHAILGWTLELQSEIVRGLFGHKNYKIVNIGEGDPFAKEEMDFINKHIEKDIDKKIKEYCRTPIIIKVGV